MAIQFQCPSGGCYKWFSAEKKPAKCPGCKTDLKAAVKKKKVPYRARVRDHHGKQQVVYADDRYSEAATRKKEQQEIALRDIYKSSNPYRQREGVGWTMKELFQWAQSTPDFKELYVTSQQALMDSWKTWLDTPLAKKKLVDIFPSEYSAELMAWKEKGKAPRTINSRLQRLSWATIRAERDMVIDAEVLSIVKRVRRYKIPKTAVVPYSVEQFLAILKATPTVKVGSKAYSTPFISFEQAHSYFADMFTIGFTTGMRLGEIIHLKWDWITPRFIRLPDWDTLLDLHMPVTKTRNPRAVPLNSFVREILNRRHDERGENGFVFHRFTNDREKRLIVDSTRIVFWKFISPFAKVPYGRKSGLTFHSTRKSFVTYAADVAPRREYIDVIVGHELEGMRAVYERIPDESLVRTMDLYDEWLQDAILRIESVKLEAPQQAIEYKPESGDMCEI